MNIEILGVQACVDRATVVAVAKAKKATPIIVADYDLDEAADQSRFLDKARNEILRYLDVA